MTDISCVALALMVQAVLSASAGSWACCDVTDSLSVCVQQLQPDEHRWLIESLPQLLLALLQYF